MCEKFSPFEEFGAHYGLPGTGGWGYCIANIAISPCQQQPKLTDMSTLEAAQNEPIMNIFHWEGTSEHAETIWGPRGVDQAKAH